MTPHSSHDDQPGDAQPGDAHPGDAHPADGTLHDLVDGTLPPAARSATDAHVAACAACAARLARLHRLMEAVAGMPRELTPPRDGWPALRAALAAYPSTALRPRRARMAQRAAPWATLTNRARVIAFAAAASLLLAVTMWGVRRAPWDARGTINRSDSVARAAAGAEPVPVASPATFAAVERDYARAAAELTAELAATRDRLPPSAATSVDRSLATIDGALAEALAALRQDPTNPELTRYVAASYEQKLDLLRRSASIVSGD